MHRTIGILGGMSPESTAVYYEHITREYTARFGDYGYPEILIYSVNFQQYVDWQREGRWDEAAKAMAEALERLRVAGADFGIVATNTMHIVLDQVQAAVQMPLVSIVDATAQAIRDAGLRSVGLLGTVFTMRERFFRDGLSRHGLEVLVPDRDEQDRINDIIYGELCRGMILPQSRAIFLAAIETLRKLGAKGVILGCTEIPLLVGPEDCGVPLFNTTILHAERALEFAVQPRERT
jgi:aspartate racemase